MKRFLCVAYGLAAIGLSSFAPAAVITSSKFSIGLGFVNPGVWSNSETSSAPGQTSTTQGQFSFVPTVVSGVGGTNGVGFTNRTLSDNGGYSAYPSAGMVNTITGTYLGSLPLDATNVQIQMNITSLRIWACDYHNVHNGEPYKWAETTSGHNDSSPTQTTGGGLEYIAADYAQLIWDPTDFTTSGTSQVRTFRVTVTGPDAAYLSLDGYEVFGNVVVSYEVPEPTCFGLAFCVLGHLSHRRVAARKRA